MERDTSKRVGIDKVKGRRADYPMGYKQCATDAEGWAKTSEFKPFPYDLCLLKLKSSQILHGWWTGKDWDGLRVPLYSKVVEWKHLPQNYI